MGWYKRIGPQIPAASVAEPHGCLAQLIAINTHESNSRGEAP